MIKGIGRRTVEKYGKELVELVLDYRQKNHIEEVIHHSVSEPAPESGGTRKEKALESDTRQISLDLLQAGLTIAQIAQSRELVVSTIEGHLAFHVQQGRLAICKVLPAEKIEVIEQALSEKARPLGEIKRVLGEDYSYGEIKLVQAHRKYLEKRGANECHPDA
jgi:uncharacterized protein YpbB